MRLAQRASVHALGGENIEALPSHEERSRAMHQFLETHLKGKATFGGALTCLLSLLRRQPEKLAGWQISIEDSCRGGPDERTCQRRAGAPPEIGRRHRHDERRCDRCCAFRAWHRRMPQSGCWRFSGVGAEDKLGDWDAPRNSHGCRPRCSLGKRDCGASSHGRASICCRTNLGVPPCQRGWPARWLVADDVGLGKTIEAGMILWPLVGARSGAACPGDLPGGFGRAVAVSACAPCSTSADDLISRSRYA